LLRLAYENPSGFYSRFVLAKFIVLPRNKS